MTTYVTVHPLWPVWVSCPISVLPTHLAAREADKSLTTSQQLKTSVCYQPCFHPKCKTEHYTSYQEEN